MVWILATPQALCSVVDFPTILLFLINTTPPDLVDILFVKSSVLNNIGTNLLMKKTLHDHDYVCTDVPPHSPSLRNCLRMPQSSREQIENCSKPFNTPGNQLINKGGLEGASVSFLSEGLRRC